MASRCSQNRSTAGQLPHVQTVDVQSVFPLGKILLLHSTFALVVDKKVGKQESGGRQTWAKRWAASLGKRVVAITSAPQRSKEKRGRPYIRS